jgi:hypothetical protein
MQFITRWKIMPVSYGRAIAQAINRRLLTAKVWVRAYSAFDVRFAVDKWHWEGFFMRVLRFSRQYHFTAAAYLLKYRLDECTMDPLFMIPYEFNLGLVSLPLRRR